MKENADIKLPANSESLFTSYRERWLWVWAGVVLAGIFASIFLVNTLVSVMRNEALAGTLFSAGMILIVVMIVVLSLKARPGGLEIGVGIGILAVYTIIFARMTVPSTRSHIIEYSVLAAIIYAALRERVENGRHVPYPAVLTIGISTGIGIIDEIIHALMPSRVFDLFDIFFDWLASVMAVTASAALIWARGFTERLMKKKEN